MDFGDLKDDQKIQEKLNNLHDSIDKIENLLSVAVNDNPEKQLSTEDKVNYDLFMCYTLNTLFWLYLRSKGVDPNKSEIKNQLCRIKQYMVKAKEAHDRNTIRPRINQAIAERFIKHGIQHSDKHKNEPPQKKPKHTRF